MKKICVVTTTRAEYGLLRNLIKNIDKDSDLQLQLVVTGSHLVSNFGFTVKEIEKDNINITEKVDILMAADSPEAISKTMGMALISFAQVFKEIEPDFLVVLGDRYELLPICLSAANFKIPIGHISGGETTEGAIDEGVRHSITKFSYLHFPSCETYRRRIIQLGENPARVYNLGDLGIENILTEELLSLEELEKALNYDLKKPYMAVTFHPTTLGKAKPREEIHHILQAITSFPEINFIFTKANADEGGSEINQIVEEFVKTSKNAVVFDSLGATKYLSLIKHSKGVLGNSSSGIVEAPAFKVGTVNIGNRQKGRIKTKSIIDCRCEENEIKAAIEKVFSHGFQKDLSKVENPFRGDNTAENIKNIIKEYLMNDKIDLKKEFYDLKSVGLKEEI